MTYSLLQDGHLLAPAHQGDVCALPLHLGLAEGNGVLPFWHIFHCCAVPVDAGVVSALAVCVDTGMLVTSWNAGHNRFCGMAPRLHVELSSPVNEL